MFGKIKNSIEELLIESSRFNSNDVLVNIDLDNSKLFFCDENLVFDVSAFPKGILRDAQKTKKESGVNSLCLASGIVKLTHNGNELNTPIFLIPLNVSINKIKSEINFTKIEDEGFINPFLAAHLSRELDVILPQEFLELDEIIVFLRGLGLTIEDGQSNMIGNFHHHRYQIIKELEELVASTTYSSNLAGLLGFPIEHEIVRQKLPVDNLFAADTDHEAVFNHIESDNLVIQGPPGTGKSQVLSNFLGKFIKMNRTTIVVSEKRVALEVLKNKLGTFGLDKLCFIATSDKLSHTFIRELKLNWDYFEAYKEVPVNNLRLSEQILDNLQMTLNMLSQRELIGGVSFHRFEELSSNVDLKSGEYSSQVSSIDAFLEFKDEVKEIYKQQLQNLLAFIKKSTLESAEFMEIDAKIKQWLSALILLQKTFDFSTWGSFVGVMKEAANCQIYENDLYKKYTAVFEHNSEEQNRFLDLRKRYISLRMEVERINQNQSHWKVIPSASETLSLLTIFEGNGNFFSKLRAKKRWKEISNLATKDASAELGKHQQEIDIINSFSQIIIEFCELGIDEVETEVPIIYQTLNSYSKDQWGALKKLSPEKRLAMTTHHKDLSELHYALKKVFHLNDELEMIPFLESLKEELPSIISGRENLLKIDENGLMALSRNESFEAYISELLNSHWLRFKDRFPTFAKFSMSDMKEKIKEVILFEAQEAKLFAKEIENSVFKTFVSYHELLNTPARKLTEEQKSFKVQLRKGKSILVKEFSKTRSHPSLRELYNSEARVWIQLLKPVWLSNPTQLAKCFPLEENLFDYAVFDEASQIPLQNALGTIQRAKRIIIAGDEHQMGPSTYFQSGAKEIMDLLHQANYYWPRAHLQHHYRSAHPDLIAFSNKHFYEGELKTYPAFGASNPIRFHSIENGRFVDRKNLIEAKKMASDIEAVLEQKGSLGIVAFSEEQLNCIWDQLSASARKKLQERMEDNSCFFKALENVQGDECDQLFISFGHGRNEEGEFHMRFGPMNTINGRNRLNVLLTRAQRTINFYCSIRSTDFKVSDNESINLLRHWIQFSENYIGENEALFPFDLHPQIEGKTLCFNRIQDTLPHAKEIVTLHRVLEARDWNVEYN